MSAIFIERNCSGDTCAVMEAELGYDDVEKVHIERGNQGFGFNIKGPTQAGGTLQAINGRLYPPLQYISHVDEGSYQCIFDLFISPFFLLKLFCNSTK